MKDQIYDYFGGSARSIIAFRFEIENEQKRD